MTEYWANRSKSTLSGAMDASQTTLTIASPASGQDFPASAPFRVVCGTEIMLVGTRVGNAFSAIARGHEGTTAAAHASGAVISHGVTAGALTDLEAQTALGGYYGPVTNGDPVTPEILFDAGGDVVMAWVAL